MDEPEIKIMTVFVCKIRKKLRAVEGHEIETVWGGLRAAATLHCQGGIANLAPNARHD